MQRTLKFRVWLATTIAVMTGIALAESVAQAQAPNPTIEMNRISSRRLLVFRSDHFELYTDLQPGETVGMLDQFEAEVSNLGVYWGRPLRGKIKCFLVSDISIWPADLLTDANGRAKIAERSGTIVAERFVNATGREVTRAVVYACAEDPVPRREIVHAFCTQTFGRTGPDWFAEGLASVACYWRRDGGVQCPPWMAEYLRNELRTSSAEIIGGGLRDRQAWQTNSHRWALCHLLSTDPRYSGRFRQFGQDLLAGRPTDFAQQFPELGPQLDADYRTFCERLSSDRNKDIAATAK